MSAGQIAAPRGRIRGPIVTALVVTAFAVGGLGGISLPRVTSGASHLDGAVAGLAAQAPAIPGVAVNTMSDAADRAFAGLAAQAPAIPGVAVNTMSDAADRAFAGLAAQAADDRRSAVNTFTKWVTTYPAMAGVVGGEVGTGVYAGEILKYVAGTTTVIEALYHFNGSKHSFTALVHVEQTGLKAEIIGVVTDGWLKGNLVNGEYTQITCTQAPDGTCFRGTLGVVRGSGSGN